MYRQKLKLSFVQWAIIALAAFLVAPTIAYATPCCVGYNSLQMRITACRVVVQHEQCRAGEFSTECERVTRHEPHYTFGDATSGYETCVSALSAANADVAPEPPAFEPVLPRLQVPLPTLQPFTAPLKITNPEGRTFLTIDFLTQYIAALYKYLVGAASIIAGVMYVWAGVKWLTSAGNPEGIGDAKKKIASASVGLILVLGSYVILYIVNPDLVFLKPLRVEFVERVSLETFDGKDLETETIIPIADIGDTRYDAVFQRFANCIPADWRFLKAIAYKESGLNTNRINPSNYIGLFQTKQKNCKSALRGYVQHQPACADLTNPAVSTAVGALMMRSALQSIRGTCAQAGTLEKLVMVYINHNMGPAVLRRAMDFGCALPQLREGSIDYYKTRGLDTAKSYAARYQTACLQSGKTAAECTGGPKFDYAVSTARATQGLGVGQIDAPATGPCPLNSTQPFLY